MEITFIFIGITSLIILIYSVKLLVKQIKLEEIAVFDLVSQNTDFTILKNGIHSICLIGLNYNFNISGLKVSLANPDGKDITLKENKIKYSYFRKGKKTFEQWSFKTKQIGIYKLNFKNLENFLSEYPFLTYKTPLSFSKIETRSLKILVKQSVSIKDRFITIIGLVLGVNGLFWGILMTIDPNVFV